MFLFQIPPRYQRNTNGVDIQSELIKLRKSYEVLRQKMIKFLIGFEPLQFKVIEVSKQNFARNMIPMITNQHFQILF